MRFWKRLRWLASVAFVLVLVAACLFADPGNPAGVREYDVVHASCYWNCRGWEADRRGA